MALVTARPVSQLLCIFPDVAKRCVMQVDGRHGVWFAKQGAMEQRCSSHTRYAGML